MTTPASSSSSASPVTPGAAAAAATGQSPSTGSSTDGGSSSGGFTAMTTVNSLGALKQKAPRVYNMMMQGIAMTIIKQSEDAQQRLKEINRKAREDSGQTG